jgi:large subunit ribosomal protein L7/L12
MERLAIRTPALVLVAALASSIMLGTAVAVAQTEPTPLGEEIGPLAAGTYVDSSTGPGVSFTVDDSWVVTGEPLPEVGTELAPAGFDGIVTLTTFDGTIFSQPCAAKGRVDKLLQKTDSIDADAASFIEAMVSHGSLEVQEVQASELGGLPALQLDVVSRPGKKCDPKTAFLWQLPIVREFHLDKGAIARIIAADVADEVVIAVIETPAETGASPFAFLDKSMALLDTIEITPAAAEPASASDAAGQTEFDVVLTEVGPDQIAVIKLVRELTGLGLKDAKDLVNAAPGALVEDVDREEAELIRTALEEQGATVEIE